MDNRWIKKYDPQIIEQELSKSTIEWLNRDGRIHRVVLTKREYEVLRFTDERMGSVFVDYQLRNGLVLK